MFWGVVNATARISNVSLQIWNLLKKMGSGTDLEGPDQRMSSDLLLITHITIFGYGECYREDIEFPSSDLESP
jgi:hypothetical protein